MTHSVTIALLLCAPVLPWSCWAAEAERPNILFISVDDLRPQLGCYGDTSILSPNIDALAKQGVLFERAYCQVAICNPSRASLMTGLRPDSVRVWDLQVHFRETVPDVVTLPQHLRKHGYHAVGMGKIYHNPFPDPQSWSEPHLWPKGTKSPYPPDIKQRIEARKKELIDAGKDNHLTKTLRGPSTATPEYEDELGHDGALCSMAIEKLAKLKQRQQPFFLAVGFIRPHLPFVAPRRYWDLYQRDKLPLADNPFLPESMPKDAMGTNHELTHYMDLAEFPTPFDEPLDEVTARRLIHGYYACVSYVDAQIGRLLTALQQQGLADNTVIVLWGDHGWKLGEHNGWSKFTNFEIDTRAPLIVVDPRHAQPGTRCHQLVEFVDIYPTLCELAHVPLADHLEGRSLKPLMENPKQLQRDAAFSQFLGHANRKTTMGYSIRTDRYRYVEWRKCSDGEITDRELYDHQNDSQENRNVAGETGYQKTIEQLTHRLAEQMPPAKLDLSPLVRSPESSQIVNLTIENNLNSPVEVNWITSRGIRRWMQEVKPGASYTLESQLGHVFVLEAQDGSLHRIIHTDYPARTVKLGDKTAENPPTKK